VFFFRGECVTSREEVLDFMGIEELDTMNGGAWISGERIL
jgi:hypothetical protein